jgi:hypothetical protein
MIKSAISSTIHTRLVTTTSIVAKLAVCAILLAGIDCAHAAKNPAAKNLATRTAKLSAAKAAQARLARLDRDWKRLHSRRQVGLLNMLVACRELGRCDGLKIHPTLGAALIRVSPERPGLGAAVATAPDKETTAPARGVYAAAKSRKPLASARFRSTQPSPAARIRSAAADTDGSEPGAASPLYGGASPINP